MFNGIDVQPYLEALVAKISENVQDERVIAAFSAVPRHPFVMQGFHAFNYETRQNVFYAPDNTEPDEWLNLVYQDSVLMIQQSGQHSPSSSSQPALMAVMLEALDVQEGMQVLEIGTGTGYNAALLARLAGESGRVDTLDYQAHLVERAKQALDSIGISDVHCHVADGLSGLPQHAPYDRIIATAGYSKVPPPLFEQLAIGGKLIMNVGSGGGLILLQKSEQGVTGHVLEQPGFFMQLVDGTQEKVTTPLKGISLEDILSLDFRLYWHWILPEIQYGKYNEGDILFRDATDTIVQLSQQDNDVRASYISTHPQAKKVLSTINQWLAAGKPQRSDYTFHITDDGQQIIQAGDILIKL